MGIVSENLGTLSKGKVGNAHSGVIEVWPLGLQDTLPIIPVPLHSPDPDVPLELPQVMADIYDEAAYDLSIDYSQPPPPPALSEADRVWVQIT